MFLRNFWDFVRLNAYGGKDFNKNSYVNYPTSARDQLNNPLGYLYIDSVIATGVPSNYPTQPNDLPAANKYMSHIFYGFTGVVGTGSTAVTVDDYKLDNDVTNQFTSTSTTMAYAVNNDGHFVITITWTGFNNSNSPITITEVGAKRYVKFGNSSGDTSITRWVEILVFRRVLTTPIVVAAKTNTTIIVSCELY